MGQHKIISQRALDPKYFGSGVVIRDYIKSKGKDSLRREILAFGYNRDEMNDLERKFVTEEVLNDPLNINLDKGGRNEYTRYQSVNDRISKSMSKARKNFPDKWPSMKGTVNGSAKRYRFVSPLGQEYLVHGTMDQFCREHNLSKATIQKALSEGWIPRRGTCAGWTIENLDTGKRTSRDTLNHGDARRGENNPYYGGKNRAK